MNGQKQKLVVILTFFLVTGCTNPSAMEKEEEFYRLYDSILGLPSGSYSLELPVTDTAEWTERPMLAKDVYLVRSKNQIEPLIVVDGEIVDVSSFKDVMVAWRLDCWEADYPLLTCRLNIDKSQKMKDLDELKKVLADIGIKRIQYAVVPKNDKVKIIDYPFVSFHPMWIQPRFYGDSIYQMLLERACSIPNQISVIQTGVDRYEINGISVSGADCKSVFMGLIQQDLDYIIRFKVTDDMTFADYMLVLTSAWEVVQELKEEYAIEKYSKHLDQVFSDEEELDLRNHFPFRFFEEKE